VVFSDRAFTNYITLEFATLQALCYDALTKQELNMGTKAQFIRGISITKDMSGISYTRACKLADIDYSTLWRFMNKPKQDILLSTLCAICEKGYETSLTKVLALGE